MVENEFTEKDKEVVILSDDEEDDQLINTNGKRLHETEAIGKRLRENQHVTEQEDFNSEGEYDNERIEGEQQYYDQYEDNETLTITKNQTLPEDHEPVIISERTQVNPLKELNDVFSEFRSQFVKSSFCYDDIETSFACGSLLQKGAPNMAMNIDGVPGPIAFPLENKDAERIFSAYPSTERNEQGEPIYLELETSKIIINLTFQEYLFESILPEVVAYLGVDEQIVKKARLQANRLYLHGNESSIKLPSSLESGAFGTVILVLPSDFKGGDATATYNGINIIFHNERTSSEGSYYMAWYNDVDVDFEPVTAGCRLAIAFSLTHDDETVKDDSIIKSLQQRRIQICEGLLSAEEQEDSKVYFDRATKYLEKQKDNFKYPIAYMLDYNYTSSSLTIDQLKSSDKTIAKFFETVAKSADYFIFLGSIEREIEGTVNDDKKKQDAKRPSKVDDCPIDEEGIYLTQRALYDEYILTRLIDSGENILENPIGLDSKDQPVIIQGPAWYARCKPDSEDYSGTVDVKEVTVKYWYSNASAIIFLPKENLAAIMEMSQFSDY